MLKTKGLLLYLGLVISFFSADKISAQEHHAIPKLQNPISVEYLKSNLNKKLPRLGLTKAEVDVLKKKIETDPLLKNHYQAIRWNANKIYQEPILERIQIGRRLLSISNEMVYRVNMLGMVYLLEKDKAALARINQELLAVCNFSDWNPSHFLDVGEMSLAVALALDWTLGDLPKSTIALAQKALIEKGLEPSYDVKSNANWWITAPHNWNQVCHGGMIAAALAIAEVNPELAAKTISRALDNMPYALSAYMPSGVYPEGSSYWNYGTGFSVLTSSMLESAFGTDFGITQYPSFLESATFMQLTIAPSGMYYNFADCGDGKGKNGNVVLAWFAYKTGNRIFLDESAFLQPVEKMDKLSRYDGMGLVWLYKIGNIKATPLPNAWKGDGSNPVIFFTGSKDDPHQYYLGAKGGQGVVNHGNMDAGSFVFELNGVRWSIDPGIQNYNDLEKIGFNLWGRCQECQRWTLITKNNYGHSTLTVNNSLHVVDGLATIKDFQTGVQPRATIDLTPTFAGQLKSATRQFVKTDAQSLLIEDEIETLPETKLVTWQMITTADVAINKEGAMLTQEGKTLKLKNLSHPQVSVSVISLYPAPLEFDKQIEGLKRIELQFPAYLFKDGKGKIQVELTGN